MLALRLLSVVPFLACASAVASNQTDTGPKLSPNAEFLAKHYPPQSLKRGEQGKVGFRIVVEPDGALGSCEVTQSSGFKSLDEATCDTIVNFARLNPVKNYEGRSVRATKVGHIDWRLPEGVKPAAVASKSATAKDPDRIICRREARTGSLVGKTKVCMTARQWAEMARQYRDQAEQIVGTGHATEDSMRACEASIGSPAGC